MDKDWFSKYDCDKQYTKRYNDSLMSSNDLDIYEQISF